MENKRGPGRARFEPGVRSLHHRRVRQLFQQRRAVRFPTELARRLAAIDLQIAGKRVGVGSHLRARVVERDVHDAAVAARLATITPDMARRGSSFDVRRKVQQQALNLPSFPTTTIGSFPQTDRQGDTE